MTPESATEDTPGLPEAEQFVRRLGRMEQLLAAVLEAADGGLPEALELPHIATIAGQLLQLPAEATDRALFALFQRKPRLSERYSVQHAMACGLLAHLLSDGLGWPAAERHSLVGAALLRSAGLLDEAWLGAVAQHHAVADAPQSLDAADPGTRMAAVLKRLDVFLAKLSPRGHRRGLLAGGEAAVVLSRGSRPTAPVVAIVIDGQGRQAHPPLIRDTAQAGLQVRGSCRIDELGLPYPIDLLWRLYKAERAELQAA